MSVTGVRQLQARLRAVGDTRGLARELGLRTVAEAKKRVAHKTRTTSRSIRLTRYTDKEAVVTVGGAGVYLERGTKPHIIRPRTKRVLRFPAKGTGTTLGGRARTGEVSRLGKGAFVFAQIVHHPGTKAQPFLIPGAKAAIRAVGAFYVVERWNRAA